MNNFLKEKVLAFLKKEPTNKYEQFNEAFELYKKSEGKSQSMEIKYNRIGFSEEGLLNLLYDLQHINKITDAELASKVMLKSRKHKLQPTENVSDLNIVEGTEQVEGIIKFEALDKPEQKTETESVSDSNMLSETATIPLREEFAFLDDPNCPELLLVVVGKKLTAYKTYQKRHAQLLDIEAGVLNVDSEELTKITTEAQEAFAENKALWDELNHYKETGEILGKHPLFKQTIAKREVDNMTNLQLANYLNSSATFISKKKALLKKEAISEDKKQDLETAIAEREYKVSLVNIKLGVNERK